MYKKLLIHIGTHKTGTTTFQNILKKYTSELLKTDELLPIWLNKFPDYKQLARITKYDDKLTDALRIFIEQKAKNGSHFIISAEGLSGISSNEVYSNTGIIAKTLKAATTNFDPQILVMFRRQDELIQSLFTQKRHQGDHLSIAEFMASINLNYLNWNVFLKPWAACFGNSNVHVLPYDRAVLSKHSVISLLNTVIKSNGLAKLDDTVIINKNVGYSTASTIVAEDINQHLNVSQQKILRRILQKVGNKGVLEEYNIISQEEKQNLVDHYYKSNAELAKKYFIKPFGMSNFSDPVFVQNNQDTKEEVLMRTIVELINTLDLEQQKTRQFPINFILRVYRRIRGFKTSLKL